MPRPVCVRCGKLYGVRATVGDRQVFEDGCPPPPPRCNLPIIKEEIWPPFNKPANVIMDPEAFERNEFGLHKVGSYHGRLGRSINRVCWDGESYRGGYSPFCGLRCAYVFARAAYDEGYRMADQGASAV